jgi:methylthioribose-1-phosphate isomerase
MAGYFLKKGEISLVVVGADRIAANGDTANKVGTYPLAVLAARHGVPFYVCAPLASVDRATPDGAAIPIERRPAREVTHVQGVAVAPEGTAVFNPAFDVTPSELIAGIVTEEGLLRPPFGPEIEAAFERSALRRPRPDADAAPAPSADPVPDEGA